MADDISQLRVWTSAPGHVNGHAMALAGTEFGVVVEQKENHCGFNMQSKE